MLFEILLTLVLVGITIFIKKWGRIIYLSRKIPGPPAYPLVGNGMLFYNKQPHENILILGDLIKKYGPMTRIWFGSQLTVLITGPEELEVLLSSQKLIDKAEFYDMIRPWLNDGLLTATGQKWHQRRKILTPAFHFKILEQFVEIFDQQGKPIIENLGKFKPEDKVELYRFISLYGLDVICESAMGTTVNAQQQQNSPYINAVKEMGTVFRERLFSLTLRNNFFFKFSQLAKGQEKALKILHDFTDKVILERRNELIYNQNKTDEFTVQNEFGIKRKKAFLDILLQSTIDGKPLSDLDIREEVDTFMFEGHDTTTTGITFCLYNIAKYPLVQEKCVEEIVSVIGRDNSKSTTLNDLNNLQYLEKVLKESMRLYPPVPIFGRTIKEETMIGGYTIPAGINVTMPIYFLGHNPKLFKNPEEFIPERFDDNAEKQHTFSYVPFSAGPRNCIGQKFAMLEMKSIVSKILRNFHIKLARDSIDVPDLVPELVLRSDKPLNFHLSPRVL